MAFPHLLHGSGCKCGQFGGRASEQRFPPPLVLDLFQDERRNRILLSVCQFTRFCHRLIEQHRHRRISIEVGQAILRHCNCDCPNMTRALQETSAVRNRELTCSSAWKGNDLDWEARDGSSCAGTAFAKLMASVGGRSTG